MTQYCMRGLLFFFKEQFCTDVVIRSDETDRHPSICGKLKLMSLCLEVELTSL